MKKSYIWLSAIGIAIFLPNSQLRAEVLAAWDYSVNTLPTTEANGITAGDTVEGTFYGHANEVGRSSANDGTLYARATAPGESVAESISENSYFEFTISPEEMITITNFSADIFSQSLAISGGVAEYTGHYFLRSSVDGYTADLATGSKLSPATTGYGQTTVRVEMSSSLTGFEGITAAVTFRLYMWVETETVSASQTLRIDDIEFSGHMGAGLPPTPASIVSLSIFSNNVMKMVVNTPSETFKYYPVSSSNLTSDSWLQVAHSDNGMNQFQTTNLSYSTTDVTGTNVVVYLDMSESQQFFKIIGE